VHLLGSNSNRPRIEKSQNDSQPDYGLSRCLSDFVDGSGWEGAFGRRSAVKGA
jgi:hypothetical protein